MSIVAISRGTFNGGQALAEGVASRLGYRCIGREGIAAAATWYGIPEALAASTTGEVPSYWQLLAGERSAYIHRVRAALWEQARDGNLVYHGHAAHLLFPGVSHVLRVRVIADLEFRIDAAMQEQKLSRRDAATYIERVDRERAEWARFLYDVEWDDPGLYDVVLNLGRVSVAGACEIVARMAELEQFKPTSESLRAMEALVLQENASVALPGRTDAASVGIREPAAGG